MTVEIYDYNTSTWEDITPIIKFQGITFSRNDIDSPDAGRDMSGLLHRGRVASKEKMEINTIPLTRSQSSRVQTLLFPETIMVRVNPYPRTNSSQTFYMYSNNVKSKYIKHDEDGDDIYELSFPLVEN